jgi:5-methylcytosine-specific restriction enzyme A
MSSNSANGSTGRWRRLRARKLGDSPTCEWPGCRARATEVDHVDPLKDGGARFVWSNLRSLCHDHHVARHGKRPRPTIDPATGIPTSNHWWAG